MDPNSEAANPILAQIREQMQDEIIANPGFDSHTIKEELLARILSTVILKVALVEKRLNDLETLLAEVDHASLPTH